MKQGIPFHHTELSSDINHTIHLNGNGKIRSINTLDEEQLARLRNLNNLLQELRELFKHK
jgi:hypothetical protein